MNESQLREVKAAFGGCYQPASQVEANGSLEPRKSIHEVSSHVAQPALGGSHSGRQVKLPMEAVCLSQSTVPLGELKVSGWAKFNLRKLGEVLLNQQAGEATVWPGENSPWNAYMP
ncbi:hypothetical protein AVEN_214205-1 [Araneus ventricosus]|uniref:Uncharacterized protein n=1 Tax=Araneus ventricosus TaxID=182803 RepID=A0A4Y2FWB3_ARAVE|nr:hypothetical protein AVEN_214205-1 [Araneus ventricosus]